MASTSPNIYPSWMDDKPFLPQSVAKYRISQSEFEEQKYHAERSAEVYRARNRVTLPITSLSSWTNGIDWSTEGAITAILEELPKKDTWNSRKLHLIAPAIRGRILHCKDDDVFYAWMGNSWHNFDKFDELYRIISKGKYFLAITTTDLVVTETFFVQVFENGMM